MEGMGGQLGQLVRESEKKGKRNQGCWKDTWKEGWKVDNMLNCGRSCSPNMHPVANLHM